MYLDLEHNRCAGDMSPPSDNVLFDNQCYATTPSSSNGNSDMEQPGQFGPARRCMMGTICQQHPQQQQQQQPLTQQQQQQQQQQIPIHVQHPQHLQYQYHPQQYQQQQFQQPQQQQMQQQQMQYQHQQQHQQQLQQQSAPVSTAGSPTHRLLLEYEMHLRNKVTDDGTAINHYETLQAMENLGASMGDDDKSSMSCSLNIFFNA